jgi:hypothetical protein
MNRIDIGGQLKHQLEDVAGGVKRWNWLYEDENKKLVRVIAELHPNNQFHLRVYEPTVEYTP